MLLPALLPEMKHREKIVHSYLLHYGYQDTVNLFDVESGILCPYIPTPQENGLNIQGDTYALNNRKILRQLIMNGDIYFAFHKLRECYPQIVQVQLTEINSSKESRLHELEAELMHCQATCTHITQELDNETFGETVPHSSEDGDQTCNHDFKLDEQIGLICQLCNFVCTEIRDVMPPFMSDCWNTTKEHWGREGFNMMGPYNLDSSSFSDAISQLDMASILGGDDNVWALIPELKLKLYSHQKKAYEFIWRNIVGSLKPKEMDIDSSDTGGCVISHSPGSGKTFLLITFIISYLRFFPRSRPLILAPKIAFYVWHKEFEKWGVQFPLHIIHPVQSFRNETWDSKIRISSLQHRKPNRKMRHLVDCISKLQQWHKESSVLLMSYSSFSLMQKDSKDEHKKFMAIILQKSPGLVVLDEGHNPRSTIS